jgi:hypothetical protein
VSVQLRQSSVKVAQRQKVTMRGQVFAPINKSNEIAPCYNWDVKLA